MKIIKKKIIYSILLTCAGIILLSAGYLRDQDSIMVGMGTGLVVVSVLKIIQFIRLMKNEEKMKRYTLLQNEERMILISIKSGNMMFFVTLIIEYLVLLVLIIIRKEMIATILCEVMALQTFGYLISYYLYNKKFL